MKINITKIEHELLVETLFYAIEDAKMALDDIEEDEANEINEYIEAFQHDEDPFLRRKRVTVLQRNSVTVWWCLTCKFGDSSACYQKI